MSKTTDELIEQANHDEDLYWDLVDTAELQREKIKGK